MKGRSRSRTVGSSLFGLMASLGILGVDSSPVLAQITLTVPAKTGCVNSGIDVASGQSIQFSATGQASYGYEGDPVNSTPQTNPDGDRFVNGINIGKKNDPNGIYPGPIGALVGKIGMNGNYFFIGSGNQIVMRQSGKLFLCYNDVNGGFSNNSGAYRVSVYRRLAQPQAPITSVPTRRSQQSTRCVRWSTFRQSIGVNTRGGPSLTVNELPNGFKQGCIFFQDNNAIDVAYVLKDGVEPSATLTDGKFSLGGAPSFNYEQSKQFDDLTARGQALMITWLTPTNGSLPYLRSIPKDRAFVRDDGMVCFSTLCMKSGAVSNQQLSQILETSRMPTERSPSSESQATTGRSQNSSQCPTGQLPVTIKTPDGQSPSYAGAARAGRNRNGKRDNGSQIEAGTRCILFVEIQKPSNPKQTWVITHGWDDSSTGSLNSLAREVAKQNPGDRVLMLDWSEASINSGDDGANPLGISEKLSRGNYYAATWIRPVAEVAVNELKNKYGISDAEANKNLNLIGHSLGSIMSAEIGYIYSKEQQNIEGNKKGVNLMIALDPPSEFNIGSSSPIGDLGGYDVDGRTPAYKDVRKPSVQTPNVRVPILNAQFLPPLTLTSPFETRTLVSNNVDRPQRFDKISRFSRAFVGKTSFAGNQVLAATANESFQMDFGERSDTPSSLGTEHMLVVEAFTKRISGAGLIPGFLGLKDRQRHTDIKQNAYPYLINFSNPTQAKYEYGHEGVINISSSNEFNAFHLESPQLGKVAFSDTKSATEDTTYRSLDLSIRGDVSRVAGGSLYPNVFEIFPSISPINYTPLIR